MKKFKPLIPVIILLGSIGCEKEFPGHVLPPPVVNKSPIVNAGTNISIFLPLDSTFLYGSAIEVANTIDSCRWKQLSGPNQAIIQAPDSFNTKISKLIKGEYSFELSVIDKGGLRAKDAVNIVVIDSLANNTLIFDVLDVTCWGPECSFLVDTSTTHIYRNLPITVFLRTKDSSVWAEIPQQNYFFSSNYFWIEWNAVDDRKKFEVMILY